MRYASLIAVLLGLLATASPGFALLYTFDSPQQPDWGNERGDWVASEGVYYAQRPQDYPPYSGLKWSVHDFTMEADVLNTHDGGIWLRSTYYAGGSGLGVTGVLLVVNSGGMYWHVQPNLGGWWNPMIGPVSFAYPHHDAHVTVRVAGDVYQASVGQWSTTLDTTDYGCSLGSGKVGFYSWDHDLTGMAFDNVSLESDELSSVPEPASCALLALAAGGIGAMLKRRKR